MRTRTALVLALLCALAGATPAQADWHDRPDPAEFESSLAPHGYWVNEAQYGRIWRPYVDWGWRPYHDGRWIWTDYGWTWSSFEPWSWTFHYGRWGWSSLYGWFWSPGYVWGPAWVDWYWGDGYVGWAPLGPPGFAVVPSYWNYVNVYDFCAPRVSTVIVSERRVPNYIVHHRDNGWGRNRPPEYRDIEVASRHQIDRQADRRPDSIAPWVHRRAERGDRVRERVFDGRSERVIEHEGRGAGRRDREPRIVDDGGWRRERPRDDGWVRGGRRGGRSDVEVLVPDRGARHDPPPVMRRERDAGGEPTVAPPLRHGGGPYPGQRQGVDDRRDWGRRPDGGRPSGREPMADRPPMIIEPRGVAPEGRGGAYERHGGGRGPTREVGRGWYGGAPGMPQGAQPAPPSGFGGGGSFVGGGGPGVPLGGGRGHR